MKISKVDHTNMGVGIKNDGSEGILYYNLGKTNDDTRIIDDALVSRVNELNRRAQRLYSVFNTIQNEKAANINKDELRTWKKVSKEFNDVIRELVRKDRKSQIQYIRNLRNEKSNVSGYFINQKEKVKEDTMSSMAKKMAAAGFGVPEFSAQSEMEEIVNKFCDMTIRVAYVRGAKRKKGENDASFSERRRVNVKDVVKKLVIAVADQHSYDSILKEITDVELNTFLDVLVEDYYKNDQLKKTVTSIKNKDTLIQVCDMDCEKRLATSHYFSKKKRPLFEYVVKYADSDDLTREKLRNEMKGLIRLYVSSGSTDGFVFSEEIEKLLRIVSNEQDRSVRKSKRAEISKAVDCEIVKKYQESFEKCKDENDRYWITFISDEAGKWIHEEIKKRNGVSLSDSTKRLSNDDLFSHLYKYYLSFLATKYIDLGKGVYHFTDFGGNAIGKILPEYENGISSFDYERITAEDCVRRDLATYISFAINCFANSVFDAKTLAEDKKEDALSAIYEKDVQFRSNAKKRILRFWGGSSTHTNVAEIDEKKLIWEVRDEIAKVRNSNIHFDAVIENCDSNSSNEILRRLLCDDYMKLNTIYAQKYYSNNLLRFYDCNDICTLVNETLYRAERPISASVPAFNRIIARSKIREFVQEWMGINVVNRISSKGTEESAKFESAVYFILKEIYYHGFLADKNLMRYFDDAVEKIGLNQKNEIKEKRAYEDFRRRYLTLKKSGINSASEICEKIMVEYSLQNTGDRTVKTCKSNSQTGKNKEIYKHFRMLLYKTIRVGFLSYLNNIDDYEFLKAPELRPEVAIDNVAEKINVEIFKGTRELIERDSDMFAWYVTAHFMSKKQVNHLCGSIKTEINYLTDIDRRAVSTKNALGKHTGEKLVMYTNLLKTLEFTINFCEQNSNVITDYFEDEVEYASFLSKFVDFDFDPKYGKDSLVSFCNTAISESKSGVVGIYSDAGNPIANSNVIRASLYGSENLFNHSAVSKVTLDDIKRYYAQMEMISNAFMHNERERSKKEQKMIREYQNLKNRVELTDITSYVDIVNDIYGQLLSWVYLRERDLTYMQLGFYYAKMIWGKSDKDARLHRVDINGRNIDKNGILYMIRAMYSHDMEMPPSKKGNRVMGFVDYYDSLGENEGEHVYLAGLELFENTHNSGINAHDEAVSLRNYIAHFKYFAKLDHSLEEIVGDIFSEFFAYNRNLHKSIPVVYKNILAKSMLIANLEAVTSNSKNYCSNTKREYSNTMWAIQKDYEIIDKFGQSRIIKGMESDRLTFKAKDVTRDLTLDAHDDNFISNVRSLLSYKI